MRNVVVLDSVSKLSVKVPYNTLFKKHIYDRARTYTARASERERERERERVNGYFVNVSAAQGQLRLTYQ